MLALAGCTAPKPDTGAAPDSTGETAAVAPGREWSALINTLALVEAPEGGGTSAGFDLDGATSAAGGRTGCGVVDYTSPWGEPGVDNGFGALLSALARVTGSSAAGIVDEAIISGGLLILVVVSGVDDPLNDPDVDIALYRALGPPMLGTDGLPERGQTLLRDPDQPVYRVEGAALVEGRIVASPLPATIPTSVFNIRLTLTLAEGAVEVVVDPEGGMTGVLGGAVDSGYLLSAAGTAPLSMTSRALFSGLVAQNADLSPDPAGTCQRIAVNFAFTAIPAFLLEEG